MLVVYRIQELHMQLVTPIKVVNVLRVHLLNIRQLGLEASPPINKLKEAKLQK